MQSLTNRSKVVSNKQMSFAERTYIIPILKGMMIDIGRDRETDIKSHKDSHINVHT